MFAGNGRNPVSNPVNPNVPLLARLKNRMPGKRVFSHIECQFGGQTLDTAIKDRGRWYLETGEPIPYDIGQIQARGLKLHAEVLAEITAINQNQQAAMGRLSIIDSPPVGQFNEVLPSLGEVLMNATGQIPKVAMRGLVLS